MDFIKVIGIGVLVFLLATHFGLHFYFKIQKKKKRALKKQQRAQAAKKDNYNNSQRES